MDTVDKKKSQQLFLNQIDQQNTFAQDDEGRMSAESTRFVEGASFLPSLRALDRLQLFSRLVAVAVVFSSFGSLREKWLTIALSVTAYVFYSALAYLWNRRLLRNNGVFSPRPNKKVWAIEHLALATCDCAFASFFWLLSSDVRGGAWILFMLPAFSNIAVMSRRLSFWVGGGVVAFLTLTGLARLVLTSSQIGTQDILFLIPILAFIALAYYQGIAITYYQNGLRESAFLYESLVKHLPVPLFRKNLRSEFLFFNKAFCEDLGIPPKEIFKKDDSAFFPPEQAQKYMDDDKRVINEKRIHDDYELNTSQGRMRLVHVVKVPVFDPWHRCLGIQGIYLVDEYRDMFLKTITTAQSSAVEAISADLAHSLKDPLSTCGHNANNMVEALKKGRLDILERNRDSLMRNLKSLEEIINTALHLARGGTPTLLSESLDDAVNTASRIVDSESRSGKSHHSPRIQITKEYPTNTIVFADKVLLWQVLVSLFDNAVRHSTGQTSITVQAKAIDSAIKIQVSNTGSSFPKPVMKTINFGLPYRAKEGKLRLGLSSCKRQVELMNGKMELRNLESGDAAVIIELKNAT